MSLGGIERLPFEDEKYTDRQIIIFRNLFALSTGYIDDEQEKFKIEASKLKQNEIPLAQQHSVDAKRYEQTHQVDGQ